LSRSASDGEVPAGPTEGEEAEAEKDRVKGFRKKKGEQGEVYENKPLLKERMFSINQGQLKTAPRQTTNEGRERDPVSLREA